MQKMIAYADKSMIPVLKDMWHACFLDDRAYIDFYFERRFSEDNMLVYLDRENRPVSMLSLLPAELLLKGNNVKKIHYIYAGATFPSHRNKGYYKSLLTYAVKWAEAAGEAVMLVPADERLREYYKKQGFLDAFQLSRKGMKVQRPSLSSMESHDEVIDSREIHIKTITSDEYKRLRDMHFSKEGYVRWGAKAVKYAVEEILFCKGECRKLTYMGKEYGILYQIDKDRKLCVKEVTAFGNEAALLVEKLALLLACNETEYVTEADYDSEDYMDYAMAAGGLTGLGRGYFNLSLG